jgi:hypothetical protein
MYCATSLLPRPVQMGLDYTVPVAVQVLKSVLYVLCDLSPTWACVDGAGLHCTSRCQGLEECTLCTV